ncbi:ROK family protein [Arthrobacter tumbae]|uniref:ROK family protein n=1 Tax=Arthrobacter tumbae TaxID=163874 RepID=UPI00195A00BF|nr:ROK family protein [Arthrobacter tumbae]MBM7780808.1 glucokinase [Arthrobacter tumbae]
MRYVIGIDLGGTKTAAGIVSEDGRVLCAARIPTAAKEGAEAILDATATLVLRLVRRAEAEGIVPAAIGIGSAGVIDGERGMVVSATDAISGWVGTRLTEGLQTRTGLACAAINDVHAHALGESWAGAAAGSSSALLVAVGTGVGGSFVVDGVPQQGARFAAGHVGHFASPYAYEFASGVASDGDAGANDIAGGAVALPCSCGGAGHVEAIASGPAILHSYNREVPLADAAPDTHAVFARASSGDKTALLVVSRAAAACGQAIGGLANILDPEVVVVSGGVAGAGPLWWDAMTRAASAELLPALAELRIVPANPATDAAVLGAARLALTRDPVKVAS